jgi:2-polyprenyl-3-methyl-5-hydroxy-6-metoxy-1,4-benzoquinol methylase
METSTLKTFYDTWWAEFQYINKIKCARAAAILDLLARTRLFQPTILDIGSGAGWMSNMLGMVGPTTGVELSRAAVEEASRRFTHVRFIEADVRTWQTPGRFDVVVAQEVLEHFENHSEFADCVGRLVCPEGYLILTTPNASTLNAMPPDIRRQYQKQPIENPVTMRQLMELLAPRFRILAKNTIIPGFGSFGFVRKIMNRKKVRRAVDALFGAGAGDGLANRLGLGLHLVLLAQRRA